MQNAKDTFYITLRSRLSTLNPDRTVVLRGAVRPAVVVTANELPSADSELFDTFQLQWTGSSIDPSENLPLCSGQCTVTYTTRGTAENAGMDRDRVLDAMDGELRSILYPLSAAKQNFSTDPATTMATSVFWSRPIFTAVERAVDRLTRSVTVAVYALQEAGEQ